MKSFSDARALLNYARTRQFAGLKEPYKAAVERPTIDPELLISTKHLLDSLMSALDYTAYGLFETALGTPNAGKRIYYPYARQTQQQANFASIFNRNMPGYRAARPQVYAEIQRFQHFSGPQFEWVPRFMNLSNSQKHHNLGDQLPFCVFAMQVRVGNERLIVQGSSWVVAIDTKVTIGGWEIKPGTYDYPNLPPLPQGAEVEILRPSEVVFGDDFSVRVFPFLRTAVEGVERIVESLIPLA